ncbi:MAG: alpha/beta fold hydrolase [Gammaproteobacteria bacterium]|nr:alpha/beta fold hydrolase [Pseudomonadales bacterium]MCP5346497.1 alpha/beta fold hydrolase [Pseudomonadales bacterium]
MRFSPRLSALLLSILFTTAFSLQAQEQILTVDHYVPVFSWAPSMPGEQAQIYVRERVLPSTATRTRNLEDRVVLFIHGAGTPAEVAFDAPYDGHSWMAYLAAAGYDTFAMDTTGYGRSTRPHVMNDICNLSQQQQQDFVPATLSRPCPASYAFGATTIESDWHDINAVVEFLRETRQVEKVHLVAWSLGGPRAAGYTALYPDKVGRLVLLAPAYSRTRPATRPAVIPVPGPAFTKQSHQDFVSNWDRQVGCADQYRQPVSDAVWGAMLDSDPVGATWGSGVRRAPRTSTWGWGPEQVGATQNPMLLVAGAEDRQVPPARVMELYEDLGASQKVLLDLGCASHNAMWESNAGILFDASLQWLRDGTVDGVSSGTIARGYDE